MSSLYPSLEDMQVHKMVQAQHSHMTAQQPQEIPLYTQNAYPQLPSAPLSTPTETFHNTSTTYPGLSDFMGLELSSTTIALNMPEYMQSTNTENRSMRTGTMIAPLSSQTVGLQRAHVTHGIREVIVCKAADEKIGLRVKDINNGIFIIYVCKNTPAALVGLVYIFGRL